MQYEIVFKGDRNVHVILAFLEVLLLLKLSRGGWLLVLLDCSTSTHDRNAKTKSSRYTYMQTKAKPKKQYNIT
jgi:hypothetical protein